MAAFPLVPAQLVLAFNPVQVCVTAGRALILSPKKKHLLSGKWNVEVILRRRRVKNLLQHFHSLVVASGCVPIWRHFYSYNSVRLGLGCPLAMSAARYSELQIAFVYADWMLRGREALRPELKRLINTPWSTIGMETIHRHNTLWTWLWIVPRPALGSRRPTAYHINSETVPPNACQNHSLAHTHTWPKWDIWALDTGYVLVARPATWAMSIVCRT